jgi:tRNA (cytidine/uridine-2'-O-)-methyltransferase
MDLRDRGNRRADCPQRNGGIARVSAAERNEELLLPISTLGFMHGEWPFGAVGVGKLNVQVVLFEPEIPPNTGSVARLCAATLTPLHLIEPLGFKIDDKHLKRAGLDYWEFVDLHVHPSWNKFLSAVRPGNLLFFSKRAVKSYTSICYHEKDFLVFGPETRGLPQALLDANADAALRIPMMGGGVRSLNLSNAVSIVLYEGLRQLGKT